MAGVVVLITCATGGVGTVAVTAFEQTGPSPALVSRSGERLQHLAVDATLTRFDRPCTAGHSAPRGGRVEATAGALLH